MYEPNPQEDRLAELELDLVRERAENQRLRVSNVRLQQLLERLREENEALKAKLALGEPLENRSSRV